VAILRNGTVAPEVRAAPWGGGFPPVLVGILVAALLVRLPLLSVFPDVQADEGLWTTSTKNFLLFGDWFMDGRNHLFLSPVFHILSIPSFLLLGPSIEAARLVSALAGVVTVGLMYILGVRLTGERAVGLVAAALMAVDPWAVIHSRQALTESVLLLFIVAAAIPLLGGRRPLVWAGALFALAILTKLNAAAMGLALGGYLLLRAPPDGSPASWRGRFTDGGIFGVTALGMAALGYFLISLVEPERFLQAFTLELGGEHLVLEGEAPPPSGRWGLDPVLAGRSALEVLRSYPFLVTLGLLGTALSWALRSPGRLLLLLWVGVGLGFPLTQVYQPIRYFYPAAPALALAAAILLVRLGEIPGVGAGGREMRGGGRRAVLLGLMLVLGFNTAYLGMSLVANRGERVQVVEAWVRENTSPDERILAASFLATNPPNPIYGYYYLAPRPEDVPEAVARTGVRYVIWDDAEWSPEARVVLDRHYHLVHQWSFGAVYRTVP